MIPLVFAALIIAACAPSPQPPPPPPPPSLTTSVQARGLHPGELVVLTVTADAPLSAVRASAFGRPLNPWATSDAGTVWRVLVGIDLDVAPGPYAVSIEADSANGPATTGHEIVVTPKAFATRRLRVNPDFVNPPEREQARIRAEAQELERLWAAPATAPVSVDLVFEPPVPHRANSAFGTRSVFNGEPRGAHGGADFLSPAGTPVTAPAHGTVVLARDLYYTGGTVILDHGLGVFSIFAHLSKTSVVPGDAVARGATVGLVGATGRVTGAHLHWTLRVAGTRVDPLAALELFGEGAQP